MRARALALGVGLLLVLGGCGGSEDEDAIPSGETAASPGETYRWSFDDVSAGGLPSDFTSLLGDWSVEEEGTAPSRPNVLRQKGAFADPEFPRLVVEGLAFTDLTVRVRCRPEAGKMDEACGLMFRVEGSDDYYVARANALEGNVRLYRVVDGDREEFGSADVPVTAGEWHTLEASAAGSTLTVSWDGAEVISESDDTFPRGGIGLWSKADSVTAFDDLEAVAQ